MNELIPLELLPSGHSAAVGHLVGGQSEVHRLEELGLRGGATSRWSRQAAPASCGWPARSSAFGPTICCAFGFARVLGVSHWRKWRSAAAGAWSTVAGSDDVSLRLLEMGLTPGVEVSVVGAAPWGGPLELEVRGYHLSLRRTEAARVAVAPL